MSAVNSKEEINLFLALHKEFNENNAVAIEFER